jgi:hypothetical protein
MKRKRIQQVKPQNPIGSSEFVYPEADDIYTKSTLQQNINPQNTAVLKESNEKQNLGNEKSFKEDVFGNDLDVPGSDADDTDELIGSEDEENNYYSLGGDNHKNLEEDDFPE